MLNYFFFQAEDGIRDLTVTGVQTCALPIYRQVDGAGRRIGRRALPDLSTRGDVACLVTTRPAAELRRVREGQRQGVGQLVDRAAVEAPLHADAAGGGAGGLDGGGRDLPLPLRPGAGGEQGAGRGPG